MSLFGDLDIASASDNPFGVDPGTYEAVVTTVETRVSEKGHLGMELTYTITDGDFEGQKVTEWKNIPQPADPKNLTADERRANSFIKQRLASLGVPESRMNVVQPSDLEGTEVNITVVQNKGYTNVRNVSLRSAATGGGANPFA